MKKTQAASEVTEWREPFCIRSTYLRKGYLTAASKVPRSKLWGNWGVEKARLWDRNKVSKPKDDQSNMPKE